MSSRIDYFRNCCFIDEMHNNTDKIHKKFCGFEISSIFTAVKKNIFFAPNLIFISPKVEITDIKMDEPTSSIFLCFIFSDLFRDGGEAQNL